MVKPTRCLHTSKPALWERNDPTCIFRRRCSLCGALGYSRHRRIIAYVCRFKGCRRDATEQVWFRYAEVHTCAEHRHEFEA